MAYKEGGVVNSLDYYLRVISNYKKRKTALVLDVPILYRGVKDSSYKLIPKIGRLRYSENDEKKLFDEFKFLTLPYLDKAPHNDWEYLALGQHYGLNTRFLDWTENALVALWFAVREGISYDEDKKPKNAAVYMLTNIGVRKNKYLLSSEREKDFQVFKNQEVLFYRPKPIDKRIIKQSGWFSVHPYNKDEKSFEKLAEKITIIVGETGKSKKDFEIEDNGITPIKIEIDHNSIIELREFLDELGINENTVFSDLPSLCEYLSWKYTKGLNRKIG